MNGLAAVQIDVVGRAVLAQVAGDARRAGHGELVAGAHAAALAVAMDTPNIALSPKFDLSPVPSKPIRNVSKAAWSNTFIPIIPGAIFAFT